MIIPTATGTVGPASPPVPTCSEIWSVPNLRVPLLSVIFLVGTLLYLYHKRLTLTTTLLNLCYSFTGYWCPTHLLYRSLQHFSPFRRVFPRKVDLGLSTHSSEGSDSLIFYVSGTPIFPDPDEFPVVNSLRRLVYAFLSPSLTDRVPLVTVVLNVDLK